MKELCKLKKSLKVDISSYIRHVASPSHVCKKCGRAGNSKKLLCSPVKIKM